MNKRANHTRHTNFITRKNKYIMYGIATETYMKTNSCIKVLNKLLQQL